MECVECVECVESVESVEQASVELEVTQVPDEGWRVRVATLAEDDPRSLLGFVVEHGDLFQVLELRHPRETRYYGSLKSALEYLRPSRAWLNELDAAGPTVNDHPAVVEGTPDPPPPAPARSFGRRDLKAPLRWAVDALRKVGP